MALLMLVAAFGHDDAARVLLEAGADPELVNPDRHTAFMLTASRGRFEMMRFLPNSERNLAAVGPGYCASLMLASKSSVRNDARARL
jgi:ankyrin repeat protein